ncbi:MAG: hypothetical protein OXU96_07450 [Gammaproteobacteria bacterium]|nr:hypothetical protein [Gammaproteobacteria bacterium]MDD9874699.1 hypothetical protein [Gammaproteobacteria bacterium]
MDDIDLTFASKLQFAKKNSAKPDKMTKQRRFARCHFFAASDIVTPNFGNQDSTGFHRIAVRRKHCEQAANE